MVKMLKRKQKSKGMCKGNILSDSVVTANETGGWHRGRTILSTASEDEDHIAFNNDHVKHDMNDDPNENEKSTEVTGGEHLDRGTVFMITTPKKDGHREIKNEKLDTTKHDRRDQTEKNIGVEKLELEKRYHEIIEKPEPQTKN